MKRWTALKIAAAGISGALALFLATLVVQGRVMSSTSRALGQSMYVFTARLLESAPFPESVRYYDQLYSESAAFEPKVWVVREDGAILASNSGSALSLGWELLPKPMAIHGIAAKAWLLDWRPRIAVVRLRDDGSDKPVYMVLEARRGGGFHALALANLVSLLFSIVLACFLSVGAVFAYLRGKSADARRVIAQLSSGDLSARFKVTPLDEFGSLMLEFNRMAEKVDQTVQKLRRSEETRLDLLDDLGHDLRTPLTSLRASIDTLLAHDSELSGTERAELFELMRGEFQYLSKLIDDLFLLESLTASHDPGSWQPIDLLRLIEAEIAQRKSSETLHVGPAPISWSFAAVPEERPWYFRGDPLLIRRMLRNSLDNALKAARSKVEVRLEAPEREWIRIRVIDDGPGLTAAQLQAFGARRKERVTAPTLRPSLGLGSVIMKSIVELHRGRLEISNRLGESREVSGAELSIDLKR